LIIAVSGVSPLSIFPPGDRNLCTFVEKSCKISPLSFLMTALTHLRQPSGLNSCLSAKSSNPCAASNLNFTVIAESVLSLYPSDTSLFASGVAQLGQYRCTLKPLYTRLSL